MKKPKVVRWLITAAISGGTLAGLSMGLVACSSTSQAASPSSNNSGTIGLKALSSIATSLDNVFKSKAPDGKALDGYSMSLYQGRFYAALLPYLFFSTTPQNPLQASAMVGRQQLNDVVMKAFNLDISTATDDDLNSVNAQLRSYLTPFQNMINRISASITTSPMVLNAYFQSTNNANPYLLITVTQNPSLTYRVMQVVQAVMSYFGMNSSGQVNNAVTNNGIRQQLGIYTDEVVQKDYYQWEGGAKADADAAFAQVIASPLAGFSNWSAVQYSEDLQKAVNDTVVTGFVTARFTGAGTYAEPINDNNYQNGVLTYSTKFLVHSTVLTNPVSPTDPANPTNPTDPNGQPTNPIRPVDQFSATVTGVDNELPTYVNTRSFPVDRVVPPVIAQPGYVIPGGYRWQDANGNEIGIEAFLALSDKATFFAVWTISPLPTTQGMSYKYSQRFVISQAKNVVTTDQTAPGDPIPADNELRKTLPSDLVTAPVAADGYVPNGSYTWVSDSGEVLTQSAYAALSEGTRFFAVWTFVRADGQPGSYRYTQPLVIALAPVVPPNSETSGRLYAVDNTVKRSLPANLLLAPTAASGYVLDGTYVWRDASGNILTENAYQNLDDGANFSAVWTFKRSSGRPASYTYTQRFVISWPAITIPSDQQSSTETPVNNTTQTALPTALLEPPLAADGFTAGNPVWTGPNGNVLTDASYAALADGTSFKAVWTLTRTDGRRGSYSYTQRFLINQDTVVVPPNQFGAEIISVNNKTRSSLPSELLNPPTPADGFVINGPYAWLDNGRGTITDAKFALLPNGITFNAVWTMVRSDNKKGSYTYSQKFLVIQSDTVSPDDQTSDAVTTVDNKKRNTLPIDTLAAPAPITGYKVSGSSWRDASGNALDDASFRALANGTSFSAVWTLIRSDGRTGGYKYVQRFAIEQALDVAPPSQSSANTVEADNIANTALPIQLISPPAALSGYRVTGPYVWQDNTGKVLTPAAYRLLADGAGFSAVWTFVRIDGRQGTYTYTQSFTVKQAPVVVPDNPPSDTDLPEVNLPIAQQVGNLLSGKTRDGTKALDGYTLSLLKGNFFASAIPYLQLDENLQVAISRPALISILAKTTKLPVGSLTDDELVGYADALSQLLDTLTPILGALGTVGAPNAKLQLTVQKVNGVAQATIKITDVPTTAASQVRDLLSGLLGGENTAASFYDGIIQQSLGLLTDGVIEQVKPADDKVRDAILSSFESVKARPLDGFSAWSDVSFDNDPDLALYGSLIVAKITATYVGGDNYQPIRHDARYSNGKLTYSIRVYVGAKGVVDNSALINKMKNELSGLTADGTKQHDGFYLSTRAAAVLLDWFSGVRYDSAGGYALSKVNVQTILKDATGLDASSLTDDDLLQLADSLVSYLSFITDRIAKIGDGSLHVTMSLAKTGTKVVQLSGTISSFNSAEVTLALKTLNEEAYTPTQSIQTVYGKLNADELTMRIKVGTDQKAQVEAALAAVRANRLAGFGAWSDIVYSADPANAANGETITASFRADYLSDTNFDEPVLGGRFVNYAVNYVVSFVFYNSDTDLPQDNAQTLGSLRAFFNGTDFVTGKPLSGYYKALNNGNFFVNLIPYFKVGEDGKFAVKRNDLLEVIRKTSGINASGLTDDEIVSLSSSVDNMIKPLRDLLPDAAKVLNITVDFTFALSKDASGKAQAAGSIITDPAQIKQLSATFMGLITGSEANLTVQTLLGLPTDAELLVRVVKNTATENSINNFFSSVSALRMDGYGAWSPITYSKPLNTVAVGEVVYASISADYVGTDTYAPYTVGGRVKDGGKVLYVIKVVLTNADGTTTAPVDHKLLIEQLIKGIGGQDPVTGLQLDGYTKSLRRGRFEMIWIANFRLASDGTYALPRPILLSLLNALTGMDASPLTDAELVQLNPAFGVLIADKLNLVTTEAKAEGNGVVTVTLSSNIALSKNGEVGIYGTLTASSFLSLAVSKANDRNNSEAEIPAQSAQVTYGFLTDETIVYTAPVGVSSNSLNGYFTAVAAKKLDRFTAWSAPSYSVNPATAKDGQVIVGKITADYLGDNEAFKPLSTDYRFDGKKVTYSIVFRVSNAVQSVTGANKLRDTMTYLTNFLSVKGTYTGTPLDGYSASLSKGEFIKALVPYITWDGTGLFHIAKKDLASLIASQSKVSIALLSDADLLSLSALFNAYLSPLSAISNVVATATGSPSSFTITLVTNEITGDLELEGKISISDSTKLDQAVAIFKKTMGSDADSDQAVASKIQLNMGLFTNDDITIEIAPDNTNSGYISGALGKILLTKLDGYGAWSEPVFSKDLASLKNGESFTATFTAPYVGDGLYGPTPASARIINGVLTYVVNFKVVLNASAIGGPNQIILQQLLSFLSGRDIGTDIKVNGFVISSRLGLALNEWLTTTILDASGAFALDRTELNQLVYRIAGIDISVLNNAELVGLKEAFKTFFVVLSDFVRDSSQGAVSLSLNLALDSNNAAVLSGTLSGPADQLASIAAKQRTASADPAFVIQSQAGYFSPQTLAVKVRYNAANPAAMQSEVEAYLAAIRARPLDLFGPWSAIKYSSALSAARPGSRITATITSDYLGTQNGAIYADPVPAGVFNGRQIVYDVVITIVGASDAVEINATDIVSRISNVLHGSDPVTGKRLDGYTDSLHKGQTLKAFFASAIVDGDATITIDKSNLLSLLKAGTGIDASSLTDDQLVSLEGSLQYFFGPLIDYVQSLSTAGISPRVVINLSKNKLGLAQGIVKITANSALATTSLIAGTASTLISDFRADPDKEIQETLGIMTSETVTFYIPASPKPNPAGAAFSVLKKITATQLLGFKAWGPWTYSANGADPKAGDIVVCTVEAAFDSASNVQPYAISGRLKPGKVVFTVNVVIGSPQVSEGGQTDPYYSMIGIFNGVDFNTGKKIDGYSTAILAGSIRSWLIQNFSPKSSSYIAKALVLKYTYIELYDTDLRSLLTAVTGYSASSLNTLQLTDLVIKLHFYINEFFDWLVSQIPYVDGITIKDYHINMYSPYVPISKKNTMSIYSPGNDWYISDSNAFSKPSLTGNVSLDGVFVTNSIWPFNLGYDTPQEISKVLSPYRGDNLTNYIYNTLDMMSYQDLKIFANEPRTMDEIRTPIVAAIARFQGKPFAGFSAWSDLKIELPAGKTFREVKRGDTITGTITAKWLNTSDEVFVKPQNARFRNNILTLSVKLVIV